MRGVGLSPSATLGARHASTADQDLREENRQRPVADRGKFEAAERAAVWPGGRQSHFLPRMIGEDDLHLRVTLEDVAFEVRFREQRGDTEPALRTSTVTAATIAIPTAWLTVADVVAVVATGDGVVGPHIQPVS